MECKWGQGYCVMVLDDADFRIKTQPACPVVSNIASPHSMAGLDPAIQGRKR
jgi:hypothetical protein